MLIKHVNGSVLFEFDTPYFKVAFAAAVKAKVCLSGANMRSADMSGADMSGADMSGADMSGANMRGADMSGADMSGANMSGADMRGANMSGANITKTRLPTFALVPEEGSFIGWKKLVGGYIAKLEIPASAARTSSLTGRKNRCSEANVLAVYSPYTVEAVSAGRQFRSQFDRSFIYEVGKTVTANLDADIRVECVSGIHFFITRQEAVDY
jgi:hypothetical protein